MTGTTTTALAEAGRDRLSSGAARARAFLLQSRSAEGWWTDFRTLAGESDEWVTAFVGAQLARSPELAARDAAVRAWRLLTRRRWWSAGRGYNAKVPADADTTSWLLLLAAGLGKEHSLTAQRARRFLAGHERDGGVATFAAPGPIRRLIRVDGPLTGWCSPHACVTAVAAQVSPARSAGWLREFLLAAQRADGSWKAYWWSDPAYGVAQACRALRSSSSGVDAIRGAVGWAERRVPTASSRSTFDLAWLAVVLTEAGRSGAAAELGRLIAARQRADGSWEGDACLRIPPPAVIDPDSYRSWRPGLGGGALVRDHRRIFTTASALVALETLVHAG